MKVSKFEDLIAWRKAQDFAVVIYKEIRPDRDFAFQDQIRRAVVSISNNIAEGFNRSTNPDFSKFLFYALASCSEVKSMLYLAERLDYLATDKRKLLIEQASALSKIITGLIKALKLVNPK